MAKSSIVSPFDQLVRAIHQLPREQKMKLYQALETDLFKRNPEQELDSALHTIWNANAGVNEDEVMADALEAIRAFRMEQAAHST